MMKLRRLLFWVTIILSLDQLTKYWVVKGMSLGDQIAIIPNFFDIVHVANPGAAFGFLGNLPDAYRLPVLLSVSLLAVALITAYYFSLPDEQRFIQIPLALILGGACGNLFDRVVRGEVVDFLSFHWHDKWFWWRLWGFSGRLKLEWPAFNVADSAITIAVLWLLVMMIRDKKLL